MKLIRFLALLTVLNLCVFSSANAADTMKIADSSKIDFVGKKTDGSHKGGFKKITGEAKVDHENPANGAIKMTIDTNSLWSDDAKLTDHLKNPDFFNVRKYPTITFESTKVEFNEAEGTITGKLTMLDKTVETKVPTKAKVNDDGSLELVATFKIDRTKWGMKYGEGKINNEVELVATIVLKK